MNRRSGHVITSMCLAGGLAAGALAGCSSGGDGASGDPADSAAQFVQGLADGDVTSMCEVYVYRSEAYTGPVHESEWTQSECEEFLRDRYGDYLGDPVFADVTVGEVAVSGGEAEIPPENLEGWPEDDNYGIDLEMFDEK